MGQQKVSDWRKLPVSLTELCIETTLRCGQSFRWRKLNDEWHCVLRGRLISLKQDASHLHYRVTWPPKLTYPRPHLTTPYLPLADGVPNPEEHDDTESLLHNYFALSLSASALYKHWAASDANFARRAPAFTGIRILNQDAWEALVAFICSSNNNIARISQMVQKLCLYYGPFVGEIDGEPFHDFPTPEALAKPQVQAHLRHLGFGYRARYIAETANILATVFSGGWLERRRNPDSPAFGSSPSTLAKQDEEDANNQTKPPTRPPPTYRSAREDLSQLPGVGPKVADCVCLMGLGWGEAVPVDTHVWQIAQRDYNFGKGSGSGGKGGGKGSGKGSGKTEPKTMSKAMYEAVGDHFREIWGPQAGWAQSVLFTANLREFAGQAKGGVEAEDPGKEEENVVAEVEVEEGGELAATTVTAVATETKTKAKAAVSQTRKRKAAVVVETVEEDGVSVKAAVVEVNTRRTSKRLKAAGK